MAARTSSVQLVSSDWGITAEAAGKRLWFRLPLPDAADADADVIAIRRGAPAGARPEARELREAGGTSARTGLAAG